MAFLPEPDYAHGTQSGTAILLVNLGTPDEPTPPAVRRYLREFLSDPRVVEIPRPIWWLILNLVILNIRPRQSAEKYASIWTQDGSPLKVHTERQAKLLQGYLGQSVKSPLRVAYAMRYGSPSIAQVMRQLKSEGCDRILAIPMYPQYAASTTGTAIDAIGRALQRMRNVPELRFVKHYHDHPAYIRALGEQVRELWRAEGRPDKLVMSFHGLPRFSLDRGDPYHCECHKTARLLAEDLELERDQWMLTFQSRFGKAEWLRPYTAEALAALPAEGKTRVDVVTPGFVADCLETLEEIAMQNREAFLAHGGEAFDYVPCLNSSTPQVALYEQLVLKHAQGWPEFEGGDDAALLAESRRRALALGAPA